MPPPLSALFMVMLWLLVSSSNALNCVSVALGMGGVPPRSRLLRIFSSVFVKLRMFGLVGIGGVHLDLT